MFIKYRVQCRKAFQQANYDSYNCLTTNSQISLIIIYCTCKPVPVMISSGMAQILLCMSKWFSSKKITRTRKFVPPRSSAKNLPRSVNNQHTRVKPQLEYQLLCTQYFVSHLNNVFEKKTTELKDYYIMQAYPNI